ncbi:ribosomal protein S18-alanine N-acetyltransferase [Thermoleptolyngbya oregonensis NK1-22]|uniref:Ribosomal protein S18-alanine N-acetyltransferase n=1 Tax=Thermoleptolyngbya oregonensis NK1-22 TaxID=2547457 RepID=A0AA97BN30_9CYAN|nr:ribosomal protein S18-alanine N-acetyltransferase [Thermoleptolyngbya oregonensis]WOB44967.1 ribosomal protein S18-alanine N-acetyltransferase [Thermoleptolyngbya oregonensis NK1-22]
MDALYLSLLTRDQVDAAVALDRQCLGGLWTEDGYLREIDSPNSTLLALTAAAGDGETSLAGLGCLWMILDEAHITTLAVHPAQRGRGLGQLLLTALMQAAWHHQMHWATLEVRASNRAAIALYQKFGFTDVGLRPRYYQNPEEDALILWRRGLQEPDFSDTLRQWWGWVGDRHRQHGWHLIPAQSPTQKEAGDLGFSAIPLDIGIFS